MKQEYKELLLKDLCARLPYGLKAVLKQTNCHNSTKHKVSEKDIYSFRTGKPLEEDYGQHDYYKVIVTDIKPYLFPLSSMNNEQRTSHNFLKHSAHANPIKLIDWYNKNHFDYRGLIPMGLANDATNLNIY